VPPTAFTAAIGGGLHHRVAEIGLARGEPHVEPERLESGELLRRARSADHMRAQRLRRLQRGHADAGGDAEHQQPLARLERALADQHVVHHAEHERYRRRRFPREALGHRHRFARVHQRVLGEGAGTAPHHALARAKARDGRTELGDFARALVAAGLGGPLGAEELAAVQARSAQAYENLPRCRLWHGDFAQFSRQCSRTRNEIPGAHG
jgi:hypothetical protein